MKPIRWLGISLIFLIVLSITHICLIYFFYKNPQTWIHNAMLKKEQIASKITKPKILVTGGSNVIYGVKTHEFQKQLGISSINLGVNAGLEIDYILDIAKRNLKSGDIVILPLEYEHFNKTKNLNQSRIAYILNYDKEYFDKLPSLEKLRYLTSISFDEFIMSFFANKNEVNYNSQTINQNGDETANFDKTKINAFVNRKSHDMAIAEPILTKSYGIEKIIEFAKWCEANNIKMFLSWGSTIDFPIYHTPRYDEYFSSLQSFFQNENIKMLGLPQDFLYPKEYFYDTNYHLNDKAMTIRTQKLIQLLYNQANLDLQENK